MVYLRLKAEDLLLVVLLVFFDGLRLFLTVGGEAVIESNCIIKLFVQLRYDLDFFQLVLLQGVIFAVKLLELLLFVFQDVFKLRDLVAEISRLVAQVHDAVDIFLFDLFIVLLPEFVLQLVLKICHQILEFLEVVFLGG